MSFTIWVTRDTKRVASGQSFRIVTEHPDTNPLPDYKILEMQWHLQKLVSMNGAVGWSEELDFSDSGSGLFDDTDVIWNNDSISKWASDMLSENRLGNMKKSYGQETDSFIKGLSTLRSNN